MNVIDDAELEAMVKRAHDAHDGKTCMHIDDLAKHAGDVDRLVAEIRFSRIAEHSFRSTAKGEVKE